MEVLKRSCCRRQQVCRSIKTWIHILSVFTVCVFIYTNASTHVPCLTYGRKTITYILALMLLKREFLGYFPTVSASLSGW